MRATVLLSDLLIYFPAVILFVRRFLYHRSGRTQVCVVLIAFIIFLLMAFTKHLASILIFLQPALILIDSGHFQFNSVMLGLTLLSLDFLCTSSDLVAAIFFVMSLGFKQMALYYAPAIGSYYLGKCLLLGIKEGCVFSFLFH